MTEQQKRTNSTLRAMLTRRDRKIADLINQNADLHAELAVAVRLAKQIKRENAMLRNNIEVLQRPRRMAKRDADAREAVRVLGLVKEAISRSKLILDNYERTTRRAL